MSRTLEDDTGTLSGRHEPTPSAVVLHGHFYQPPREDPRTDQVRDEPSAAPFANWNERITEECYAPLARSGAFEWMSFDLGPTLARWLAREHPDVHAAFVEGDRSSRERLGHGNAIAQPYHHVILPLSSAREKATEIRWGMDDFERRFGRPAVGMWLPETAVDHETLSAVAAAGIAFTIVAPRQVEETPERGVGRLRLDGGREIAVVVYDGDLAHGVAFGALLEGEDAWFDRLRVLADANTALIALAADGETFGHHHVGADRALGDVISRIRRSPAHRLENFASYLARQSDLPELTLVEPSSWSCAHGVERWRSDCGCKMAPERPSQQRWRRPLRAALDSLAAGIDGLYAGLGEGLLVDPSAAREELAGGFGAEADALRSYAAERAISADSVEAAATLLEAARARAAMFTSCAWFFDDVAGIESRQVLSYAAHALDRLSTLAPDPTARLESEFVDALREAPSNDPDHASAAEVYLRGVRGSPSVPDPANGPEGSP